MIAIRIIKAISHRKAGRYCENLNNNMLQKKLKANCRA